MGFWKEEYDVKVRDRLDDVERTIRLSQGPTVPTQEAAEVKIATQATSYGGDHPGFEVIPKDQGKYDAKFSEWVRENPEKAEVLHKRLENFNQNPSKLSALRNEIDAATQEVQDQERKRKAAAAGV
jgi:succinylglutamate desuccinylase